MKQVFTLIALLGLIGGRASAQIRPDHVVIEILENVGYDDVKDSSNAPYLNQLLNDTDAAVLTESFALTHPSQPNYLMLYSGSNQGVTDDNQSPNIPFTTPNLGAELIQKGFTFTGYAEGLPKVGYTGATSGQYAAKHCPWTNWQGTGTNQTAATCNQPLTSFPTDYTKLPTLSFVMPNLLDDMHSASIQQGDSWLKTHLGSYIDWCKTHNSLFVLTFDEDDTLSEANQIMTIIIGQNIKAGIYTQRITHYNVLRTLEDLYGLSHAGKSADSSAIVGIWKSALPIKLENIIASRIGDNNLIEWVSGTETKGAYFEIQSSNDGKTFEAIGKVNAMGSNSKYSFTDDNAADNTTTYYRLKMVDNNGSFSYSNVVSVATVAHQFTISPNPAKDFVSINFNKTIETGTITVRNLRGKTVAQQTFEGNTTSFKLDTQTLANGVYVVTVTTTEGSYNQKLLISK